MYAYNTPTTHTPLPTFSCCYTAAWGIQEHRAAFRTHRLHPFITSQHLTFACHLSETTKETSHEPLKGGPYKQRAQLPAVENMAVSLH